MKLNAETDWRAVMSAASSTDETSSQQQTSLGDLGEITFEFGADSSDPPLLTPDEIESTPDTNEWGFIPNRPNRLLLLGGVALVVVGVTAFFTFRNPSSTEGSEKSEKETVTQEDGSLEALKQENESLKASQALDSQKRMLKGNNPSANTPQTSGQPSSSVSSPSRPTPTAPPTPVSSSSRPTPPPVSSPPPPVQVVYRDRPPQIINRDRPSYSSTSPSSVHVPVSPPSVSPSMRVASVSRSSPVIQPQPMSSQDPQKAWEQASQLGVYGGQNPTQTQTQLVSAQNNSGRTQLVSAQNNSGRTPVATSIPRPRPPFDPRNPHGEVYEDDSEVAQSQLEQSVLTGQPQSVVIIPAGTELRGRTLHAIAWDDPQLVENSSIPIELSEGLEDSTGKTILPAGTQVMATIIQARDSGILLMSVNRLPINGGYQEFPLKTGVLAVSQPDGMPLVAEARHQGVNPPKQSIDGVGLTLDLFNAISPMLNNNSEGTDYYRDAYQTQRLENIYNEHFRNNNNPYSSHQPPRQSATIMQLLAGTPVTLVFREQVQIFQSF